MNSDFGWKIMVRRTNSKYQQYVPGTASMADNLFQMPMYRIN